MLCDETNPFSGICLCLVYLSLGRYEFGCNWYRLSFHPLVRGPSQDDNVSRLSVRLATIGDESIIDEPTAEWNTFYPDRNRRWL